MIDLSIRFLSSFFIILALSGQFFATFASSYSESEDSSDEYCSSTGAGGHLLPSSFDEKKEKRSSSEPEEAPPPQLFPFDEQLAGENPYDPDENPTHNPFTSDGKNPFVKNNSPTIINAVPSSSHSLDSEPDQIVRWRQPSSRGTSNNTAPAKLVSIPPYQAAKPPALNAPPPTMRNQAVQRSAK